MRSRSVNNGRQSRPNGAQSRRLFERQEHTVNHRRDERNVEKEKRPAQRINRRRSGAEWHHSSTIRRL